MDLGGLLPAVSAQDGGFNAADRVGGETATLAVLEGDAVEHVERVLGRRLRWRRTGVGLREAVGEALCQDATDTSRAAGRMLILYRLLPDRLLDRVILRFLGLPRAFGVRTELLDPATEAFADGPKS